MKPRYLFVPLLLVLGQGCHLTFATFERTDSEDSGPTGMDGGDGLDAGMCQEGSERACPGGSSMGECRAGTQVCVDQTWSACAGAVEPVDEICDGLDNDCDGTPDQPEADTCPGGQCLLGRCRFDSWARSWGGMEGDLLSFIDADQRGNTVVGGTFIGESDFLGLVRDSGMSGPVGTYVMSLDARGSRRWLLTIGSHVDFFLNDLSVSPDGTTYLVGVLTGTHDFGGGPITGDAAHPSVLLAVNDEGSVTWQLPLPLRVNALATLPNGEVIAAGSFTTSTDFGRGQRVVPAGESHIAVLRYAPPGTLVWDAVVSGNARIEGLSASNSNVHMVGSMTPTGFVDLNGERVVNDNPAFGFDIFGIGLDAASGNLVWGEVWPQRNGDLSLIKVSSLANGSMVLVGAFDQQVEFDMQTFSYAAPPGPAEMAAASGIFAFNSEGRLAWHRLLQSEGDWTFTRIHGLDVDVLGRLSIVGGFQNRLDFGGGLRGTPGTDGSFVARYNGADGSYVSGEVLTSTSPTGSYAIIGSTSGAGGSVTYAGNFLGDIDFGSGPFSSRGDTDSFAYRLAD